MSFWNRASGDIRRGDTAGKVLERNKGAGPGFEMLRIILAVGVLVAHLKWITGSHDFIDSVGVPNLGAHAHILIQPRFFYPMMYENSPWRHAMRISLVPMFFALSGFLVTGSALRLRSISTFLAFRAIRIVPALSVEITLSALVLGPILTQFTLKHYFSDPLLYSYFLNILGDCHYLLPGLYVTNPTRIVNGNLWTLPGEFLCYAAMALVMAAGLFYNRTALTIAFLAATVLLFLAAAIFHVGTGGAMWPVDCLAMFFLAGVVVYQWRDACPIRFDLFAVAVVAALVMISSPVLLYLAPLPMAYCTIFLGMYRFPSPRFIVSGDYSYGIYLYGAPLTQALIFIFPVFRGHPNLIMIPATALAYGFAAASWHLVEKPALSFKTHLPERWFPRHRKVILPSVGIVDAPAPPASRPADRIDPPGLIAVAGEHAPPIAISPVLGTTAPS